MKLYNPLKPHIVELNNGKFAVRRFTAIGWQYVDSRQPHDYWWADIEFKHHFQLDAIERAQEVLAKATLSNKPTSKTKVVKVHL